MYRWISGCLLVVAVFAAQGCGGGGASDSTTVADNSGSSGSMPTSPTMMSPPGAGGDATSEMGAMGMGPGTGAGSMPGMEGTYGAAEDGMSAYGAGAASSGPTDAAMDPAMMAAAYAAGEDGAYAGAVPTGDAATMTMPAEGYPGAIGESGPTDAAMIEYGGVGPDGATGYPGGAGVSEEPTPTTFDGLSKLAFRQGRDRDAIHYLYAHSLTTEEGASTVLPAIRWVPALKRPALAVRWGVGFVVSAPRNFAGDPKPIGSTQTLPTRGQPRGGEGGGFGAASGGMEGGMTSGSSSGENALLAKGAGELGTKLAEAYTERVERGDYGQPIQEAMEERNGGGGANRGGGSGYAGMAGGAAGMMGGMEGMAGGVADGVAAALSGSSVTQILPGLSMLGIGTQKELVQRARDQEIDALVVLDVTLRVSPTGLVTNETSISLYETATQKKLHGTKKFNNIKVQTDRQEGKDDGVDKELDRLFEAVDSGLKMVDLPTALNTEIVARRLADQVSKKSDNPLPILVEAQMFQRKGLLDEAALFRAYEEILGVDFGRLLATGTEEEKKRVLEQWLPKT